MSPSALHLSTRTRTWGSPSALLPLIRWSIHYCTIYLWGLSKSGNCCYSLTQHKDNFEKGTVLWLRSALTLLLFSHSVYTLCPPWSKWPAFTKPLKEKKRKYILNTKSILPEEKTCNSPQIVWIPEFSLFTIWVVCNWLWLRWFDHDFDCLVILTQRQY